MGKGRVFPFRPTSIIFAPLLTMMNEKHVILRDIDSVSFYGAANCHLKMLKSLYPKVRLTARGDVLCIAGSEEDIERVEAQVEAMVGHIVTFNSITEEDIIDIFNGKRTKAEAAGGAIVYNVSGKPVKSRSENQQRIVDGFAANDLLFAIGPAGSGKTYVSIALAVRELKEKRVRKIILSRPAVEAGEKLGFLPGDMKDKIDPYLQPLYDALEDMVPQAKLQDLMDKRVIQIAPLAFMRGRTLSDAVVILDEAQNTTPAQLKMFLTRMGWNTKMVVTGDTTQVDLPQGHASGLTDAVGKLDGVEGVAVVRLTKKDIVRHKLVTAIVKAYEEHDNKTQIR